MEVTMPLIVWKTYKRCTGATCSLLVISAADYINYVYIYNCIACSEV